MSLGEGLVSEPQGSVRGGGRRVVGEVENGEVNRVLLWCEYSSFNKGCYMNLLENISNS